MGKKSRRFGEVEFSGCKGALETHLSGEAPRTPRVGEPALQIVGACGGAAPQGGVYKIWWSSTKNGRKPMVDGEHVCRLLVMHVDAVHCLPIMHSAV